ncbi:MAG: lysophospholipid acyltransferase family protein [Acidobacteria bacterium]|nr:lysophospholipid acyltransferase family protein [Acidobacteriota bacterium]
MKARPLRFGHHLVFGALKLSLLIGSVFPLPVLRWLGRTLARCARPFVAGERRREDEHLKIAFPEMEGPCRRDLRRRSEIHLGNVAGEIAWLMHADERQVAALCDITGVEHLHKALEGGKGVILITAHAGNWELLNARLGVAGIPLSIAVREVYDPRIDAVATDLRSRFGGNVIHRGKGTARRLFAALKANRVNGLLIDQDIRDLPGVFVPFFGREAWTPSGPAGFSLKIGCPTIPAFIHRREDGSHTVEVHPPLPRPVDGSTEDQIRQLTAAATAAIEQHVRAHPDQWVWMHRRWRTRPEGEGAANVQRPTSNVQL